MRPFCQTNLTTFIYYKFSIEFQGILKIGQQLAKLQARLHLTRADKWPVFRATV